MKQLVELSPNVNEYIESLQKSADAISLKRQLTQELECPASDWIRNTLLEYLKLFKCNYLPLTDQSEGDVLHRVWFFLDTVFDNSKISWAKSRGKAKSNWEYIAMAINDKRLGLSHYAPQSDRNTNINSSGSSRTTTTATATAASSGSESSNTTKQLKLCSDDKEKIKNLFDSLDESKMWKLSTGTIVEEKMKEFALNCIYEHPVHSMIIDLSDIKWKKYLTAEEINEVRTFKQKELVGLPSEVEDYFESLKKSIDSVALKTQLTEDLDCSACSWIKRTLLEYLNLFKCNYLPLTDQSEGDVLRRVWIFLDTVFDDSKINCRGGEKSSKSSAAARNNERAIAGEEKMERKLIGRKVDLLFQRQHLEYGCSECGRYEDQTKELYDGSFKVVKVLKDMLYNLHNTAPNSVREFILVGFLMFVLVNLPVENKFSLALCDSPMGYVTRITRTRGLFLPEESDDICIKLLPMLKLAYQARLTMERTNEIVRRSAPEVKVTWKNSRFIPPCFNAGKRKRSNED
ncbi:hypothetical protein G6F57_013189 [Rhizopus arrhizus]|nr:hypothetical protein G6F30_009616 [Rhizopus arrhizus]KAG0977656.1 hypothetical protein G6F29_009903 [Rhizopus arrhizus]KAG0998695.1 hypothetical protein G6F28_001716 [Rhizopus arrhizus]KAG1014962.1 hypothetical protein G6F27_000499 [Rhizopus arrhizus]KAG1019851.1 hypothetical protein G6F26_009776 [Rhizopus arrhizus]